MVDTKIIVAIDIGSSSVRCSAYELFDAQQHLDAKEAPVKAIGNCRASRPVRSVQPNTGKIELLGHTNHEHTSDRVSLMEQLDECMDELLNKIRNTVFEGGFQIVAVGFSSFVMNLVGVDSDGKIVGDEASISYACNSPDVTEQCRRLRSQLSEDAMQEMYQNTGAPIHSAYALPQLLAIYDNDNHNYDKSRRHIHKWQTIASICLCRWTGATLLPISFSEASWTGLLNFRTCDYESSLVTLLPESCRRALPALADFSDTSCPALWDGISKQQSKDPATSNPYWNRWPELRGGSDGGGCRLFLGIGDGACANIGSKCSTVNRIAVTIGTSAAARVCLPFPVVEKDSTATIRVPQGLFCYRVNRSHVLVGGALTDGGCVVEWASNLLNLSSTEALNECMSRVEGLVQEDYSHANLSSHDEKSQRQHLSMIPFLSGERSTGFRDGATGALIGLTRETTPAHLLKSCLEGVTLRLKAVLDLIKNVIQNCSDESQNFEGKGYSCTIIASGKALEVNALWRQMLSDCCGMEVIMDMETEEGTSRGVAVAVAVALKETGRVSDSLRFTDEPIVVSAQSTPNLIGKSYWKNATDSHDLFLDSISPMYH